MLLTAGDGFALRKNQCHVGTFFSQWQCHGAVGINPVKLIETSEMGKIPLANKMVLLEIDLIFEPKPERATL